MWSLTVTAADGSFPLNPHWNTTERRYSRVGSLAVALDGLAEVARELAADYEGASWMEVSAWLRDEAGAGPHKELSVGIQGGIGAAGAVGALDALCALAEELFVPKVEAEEARAAARQRFSLAAFKDENPGVGTADPGPKEAENHVTKQQPETGKPKAKSTKPSARKAPARPAAVYRDRRTGREVRELREPAGAAVAEPRVGARITVGPKAGRRGRTRMYAVHSIEDDGETMTVLLDPR